ncbi:MAG: DUF481 domain-containing protein [Pontiellaceae bacterium]|nr:DUF481 domain-containing protein [Pontiellaceae bacterium]
MKKVAGLIGCMVLVAGSAFAQMADTNVTWKSSVSLGASFKSGNTDKTLYTMNIKLDRFSQRSDLISSLYGEQGTTEGEQTEGQLRGQGDLRFKFAGQNYYGGVFTEVYHDAIKEVNARVKVGPNFGVYLIKNDTMMLDLSAGLNEVYERTAADERAFGEWRVAASYSWDVSESADYYLKAEYSADVDDTEDGTGLLVTGLKTKVSDKLSLFVELRDEYDNMPDGAGMEYNDVTVLAGLTFDIM